MPYVVTFNRFARKGDRAVVGGKGRDAVGKHNVWKTKQAAKRSVAYRRLKAWPGNWNPRVKKVRV